MKFQVRRRNYDDTDGGLEEWSTEAVLGAIKLTNPIKDSDQPHPRFRCLSLVQCQASN